MGDEAPRRRKRIVVGISGASGTSLALHFLRLAASHPDVERIHLVVSSNALRVASHECEPPATTPAAIVDRCGLDPDAAARIIHHPHADIGASIASGSYRTDGMVIIPCSSATLAAVCQGASRGLIQRAADLTLKERRRLILALRETPFSLIHAENIAAATRAGAIVMPPIPSFYAGETWEQYLDHFAMRVLDLLGIDVERDDLRWEPQRG
jgi:polyprenyl P-hydroxybenzoate/phenylacrylic acid decarboxylase-like protein